MSSLRADIKLSYLKQIHDFVWQQLPLYIVFLPDLHTGNAYRRCSCVLYTKRKRILRTVRALAQTCIHEGSCLLECWDVNRLSSMFEKYRGVCQKAIHRFTPALSAAHDLSMEQIGEQFNKIVQEYCSVCFDANQVLPFVVYKKVAMKHSVMYVALSNYTKVKNQIEVLKFTQLLEYLGAKRIVYKKRTTRHTTRTRKATIAARLLHTSAMVHHHAEEETCTTRETEYDANCSFQFSIRAFLENVDSSPFAYFRMEDIHHDIELKHLLRSRIKEYMNHYTRTFETSRQIENEIRIQTEITKLSTLFKMNMDTSHLEYTMETVEVDVEFFPVEELCDIHNVPVSFSGFQLMRRIAGSDQDVRVHTRLFYERFLAKMGISIGVHQEALLSGHEYKQLVENIHTFYDMHHAYHHLKHCQYTPYARSTLVV